VAAIVGDPAVAPSASPGVFRLAASPAAQGTAFAQLLRARVVPTATARAVRVLAGQDAPGRELLAALRAGLRGSPLRVRVLRPGALARLGTSGVARLLRRGRTAALVLDGPAAGGADARAVAAAGRALGDALEPAPVLASERVLSEAWVRSAGALGRIGALQGVSEVSPDTADGVLYQQAVPLLHPGELASLDGLRGSATGQALLDAVRGGTSTAELLARLRRPDVFSRALLAPWDARRPGAGSPSVVALQPQFLSSTLVPAQYGGESQDSTYFPQGSWTVTSPTALGRGA
jgi:hypothetical protein